MATTLAFKDFVDEPQWRPSPPATGFGNGACMASDLRNSSQRVPFIYFLRATATLEAYNPLNGGWMLLPSPALTSLGSGTAAIFAPSQGPRGTLAAGATTTKVVLTTALPAIVGINQLANKGDGVGFTLRICGLASGKVEERVIVANTSSTTPTIWVNTAFSFTPATGDTYEILSGRVFLLGNGAAASGVYKYYDIATNSISAALAFTNLPTGTTDAAGIHLSESLVSSDRSPGEGFIAGGATSDSKNCIAVTATSSTTLTAAGMPADLQASEYANFQVRVVEDTVAPTAVGQRRRISSHTSGATGVFTVAAFAVTPSISAKFVVENDDDKIIVRSTATTTVYTYNITANTWDTTTFGAASTANGAGNVMAQAFGTVRDTTNNHRHSFVYFTRGGGATAIDVLDIAGGANGVWANAITYGGLSTTFNTATTGVYDGATQGGRYIYLNTGVQTNFRFDVRARTFEPWAYLRYPQSSANVGSRMGYGLLIDGATKLANIYMLTTGQTQMFSILAQR